MSGYESCIQESFDRVLILGEGNMAGLIKRTSISRNYLQSPGFAVLDPVLIGGRARIALPVARTGRAR